MPLVEAPARSAARVELGIIRRLLAPPARLTGTEWADRKRVLPETSTQPGPYDSTRAPYQRRPMDAIGDPGNHLVVLCWASQTGKALALDTAIPTPTGWSPLGDLTPGDMVFGRTGYPTAVVAVGKTWQTRPCFRVTFDDRASIVADAEHEWVVCGHSHGKPIDRVVTTQQMWGMGLLCKS